MNERFNGPSSPEIYNECLLTLMDSANHGDETSRELALDCVAQSDAAAAGFICKKAGCRLLVDNGVLYNASNCQLVKDGTMQVPGSLL